MEIRGHLHGERAAWRHGLHEARNEARVVVQPMQRGVAVDEIDARGGGCGRPSGKVRELPRDPGPIRNRLASLRKHLCRIVYANKLRVRPAFDENPGDVPGAAPQVDNTPWRGEIDACHEIERRAQALARVLEILPGLPRHRRLLLRRNALARSNSGAVRSSKTTTRVTGKAVTSGTAGCGA